VEGPNTNRHLRARVAETLKGASRHATSDAPERIYHRRRRIRLDHRTCFRGSRGSASLPRHTCGNASKCATPLRAGARPYRATRAKTRRDVRRRTGSLVYWRKRSISGLICDRQKAKYSRTLSLDLLNSRPCLLSSKASSEAPQANLRATFGTGPLFRNR